MKALIGLIFVTMLTSNIVEAKIINVPADQPTIQAGIDAATTGDTVLVADGTYTGDGNTTLDVSGKAIVLKSENGAENCIIDCISGNSQIAPFVFAFVGLESSNSVLDGFTFMNSSLPVIHCENSSPTIKNNIITNNYVGIVCSASSALIIGNRISDNSHGSIDLFYSSPIIKNNIIENNTSKYGSGIYCYGGTPSIINNTIIGNSSITSVYEGDDSPTLSCEYDNHNRISECFIEEAQISGAGAGIYINSSSPEIMNNIIAFSSQESSESPHRLNRWFDTDLFMRYNYEGASLKSVTYYYGFMNNGEPGDVNLSGCIADTSFTIQSGEKYWMETTSFVSNSGDGGGINLTISLGDDSLRLNVILELFPGHFGGCYYLYNTNLQSYAGMSAAGIIAIGDDSFPNIAYNDIYGNEGGNYLVGTTSDSTYAVNLTGIDGNISQDPLCESPDYLLSEGSPCIDTGNPDSAYNDRYLPPGMGTERCDIGAYGGSGNDIITSVEDYTAIPSQFVLYQNYPNPFNPTTTINYSIPINGFVSLEVFDILGRKIILLVNEEKSAGQYVVLFDASELLSGIYFYRLQMNKFSVINKFVLVK